MNTISLKTEGDSRGFAPGEVVRGEITWDLESEPEHIELHAIWHTEGKGTRDAGLVVTRRFDTVSRRDEVHFEIKMPQAPYSYEGNLISIVWLLEAVAMPSGKATQVPITLGPDRAAITAAGANTP